MDLRGSLKMDLRGHLVFLALAGLVTASADPGPVYRNPVDCAVDSAGHRAFVALAGPRAIGVVDLHKDVMVAQWPLPDTPNGVAVAPRGDSIAVAIGESTGQIVLLNPANGAVMHRFSAGFSPVSPLFLKDGKVIAVCNQFTDSISLIRVATGELLGKVAVGHQPVSAVTAADGRFLFVGCLIPSQPATAEHVATTVEVIDIESLRRTRSILLPNGSTGLRGMTASPDGKLVFLTHIVGHHQLPANQLERGWMNSNALSVIDTAAATLLGTVLLDDTNLGAANPWGVAIAADGKYLAVAHSGSHELSRIPLELLLEILRKESAGANGAVSGDHPDAAYGSDSGLANDLTAMTRTGRVRIPLPGGGPRTVVAAGSRVLVCDYFGDRLLGVDLAEPDSKRIVPTPISLGPEPAMDIVRRGEMRFADARLCYQGWQSCVSCHPNMRSDGLNWDLLNDGVGNPKQTKSMLFAHVTPPSMALGTRANAELAVRSGIRFIQFAEVVEEQAQAIDEFLKSLRPIPSPFLVDGHLSPRALKGRAVFDRIGCANCHSGPYFTNLQSYCMPYASGADAGREFDTPTLREVWRTPPYLYDGRAATMREALQIKTKGCKNLSQNDLDDLVEYVLSL